MRAAGCGRARARRVMLDLFIRLDGHRFLGASFSFPSLAAAAAAAATATVTGVGGGGAQQTQQRQVADCTVCGESVGFSQ